MKWSQHPNARRWLSPPTIEIIDAVVKASGSSELQFERYHGIYPGCIKNIRLGGKRMPIQFWHLFYAEGKALPSLVSNLVPNSVLNSVSKIPASTPRPKKDSRISNLL